MGRKKKVGSISTFLGYGSSIEGTLEFQGTIRLDGNVRGRITSNGGTVIVGEKAVINADIIVDGAIIMGEVNGTIDAKDRIEVYPPGRVVGDIQAPMISIDTGAVFNGNCGMKGQQTVFEKKSPDSSEKLAITDEPKKK
ncbi:bactofilin family protein [Desulfonema magnum]|uniref:Polymer-forming cytoskeletal bactofilin n=1 Tax=Desulfonema magnum TaxID=45655 RepID=A0A975GTL5_9BACT|nr:polymer-forming cytoskeletal protein [Desulfonema magnum]QTA93209.1 Putative polymer-forming cytoskeletal bactofilin [Desulfonema magnum]